MMTALVEQRVTAERGSDPSMALDFQSKSETDFRSIRCVNEIRVPADDAPRAAIPLEVLQL